MEVVATTPDPPHAACGWIGGGDGGLSCMRSAILVATAPSALPSLFAYFLSSLIPFSGAFFGTFWGFF